MANCGERRIRGVPSRISRQQVLDAARRHFLHDETQSDLASELGISASYLARLIRAAKGPGGWMRLKIETEIDPNAIAVDHLCERVDGQSATVIDGSRICTVVDTLYASPSRQSMTIGDVTVTIIVERK